MNFKDWLIDVSPEEVLGMFDYQDSHRNLYPGYDQHDNEYEQEYYFASREKAYEAVREIVSIFEALPDPIPVYRAIRANSQQEISPDYGESWSFRKESALSFGAHAGANYLLSGLINKKDVNWKESIRLYILNSYAHYDDSAEDEIVIPNPEMVINFKAEPIRRRK